MKNKNKIKIKLLSLIFLLRRVKGFFVLKVRDRLSLSEKFFTGCKEFLRFFAYIAFFLQEPSQLLVIDSEICLVWELHVNKSEY
jgi:hypothetical protein